MNTQPTPYQSTAKLLEQKRLSNLEKGRVLGQTRPRLLNSKLAEVVRAFLEGATVKEASAESGVSVKVINRFIKNLRFPLYTRVLYILSWEKSHRTYIPVYKLGIGHDRPRPPLQTPEERRNRRAARARQLKLLRATAASPTSPTDGE